MGQPMDVRLNREAAVFWGHVPADAAILPNTKPYNQHLDDNPVNAVQFIAYAAVDVFFNFTKSLKEVTFVKNCLNALYAINWYNHDVPLSAEFCKACRDFKVAAAILSATEAVNKLSNVFSPLRERTIHVVGNAAGTVLRDDGTVENGVRAGPAGAYEIVARKTAQIADWLGSVADLGKVCIAEQVIPPNVISWVNLHNVTILGGVSSVISSSYEIYEETVRLATGNVVRAERNKENLLADGFVWATSWEDHLNSWIKIAMHVSYIALGALTLATLVTAVNPGVLVFFLGFASITHLASYLWERITIDSTLRSQQRFIQV